MPAEFQTKFDGQTYQVTARELQNLKDKGYELRPSTNPEWLQKGIRFESVALHRDETHGPAAQLVVFRDHPPTVPHQPPWADAHRKDRGPEDLLSDCHG